jgi:hypothetical protein
MTQAIWSPRRGRDSVVRRLSLEERFWEKVNRNGPVPSERPDLGSCWTWEASIDPSGYGRFGVKKQVRKSHRVAWEIAHGPIPDGLHVLHKCDNPACVRVDHLFLGTNRDNTLDKIRKGRQPTGDRHWKRARPELGLRGEKHAMAKLTEAQVIEIRRLHSAGLNQRELGERFRVSRSTIHLVVSRKLWRHI